MPFFRGNKQPNQEPNKIAARALSWEQYCASLPYLVISGVKYPYLTFNGVKVPSIVFDDAAQNGKTSWNNTWSGVVTLEGHWNKKLYLLSPFPWQFDSSIQTALSYELKDITHVNDDTWVDKIGMAGAMIGVGAAFGAAFGAIGESVTTGATLASGATVTATATESLFTAQSALKLTQGTVGNSQTGAALKLATIGSNYLDTNVSDSISTQSNGVTQMDELDFGGSGEVDFTNAFDPVDYSSGEGITAFSDASNVDFGFGAVAPTDSALVIGPEVYDFGGGTGAAYDFNATAESTTSDYGSSSQGNPGFDSSNFKGLSSGVNVAQQVAKATQANNSVTQTATKSGGGQKYSQTMQSIGTAVAQASAPSQGSAPVLTQLVGLVKQLESSAPRTYAGQLSGNKTSPAVANNNMLLIGGALVMVALLMHFKG